VMLGRPLHESQLCFIAKPYAIVFYGVI